jgi:HEAT repeat protein
MVLANLLDFTKDDITRYSLAEKLLKLTPNNPTAIKVFRDLFENSQDEHIRLYASGYLELEKSEEINFLVKLIDTTSDFDFSLEVAQILLKIDPNNRKLIDYLSSNVEDLAAHQEETIRQGVASSFISIDYEPIKRQAMKTLIELLSPNYQENTRLFSVRSLYNIAPDQEDATNTAIELLLNSQEEDWKRLSAHLLSKTKSQKLLPRVVTALKSSLKAEFSKACYEALWKHSQNMPYPVFYQAWHQTTIHETG